MENTLHLLTLILGAIQIIDIAISLGLYFAYGKNQDYLAVLAIWVGNCGMFIGDNLLGPLSLNHIYFSYSYVGITGIAMAELVSKHYNIPFKIYAHSILFMGCFAFSVLLRILGVTNFTVLAFVMSIGIVYPVLSNTFLAFKKLMQRHQKERSAMDFVFLFTVAIWGLHFLDYPFLRPMDDIRFSIFGFSFAIVITYLTSVLLPVVVNRRIHLDLNNLMAKKLGQKSDELNSAYEQIIAKERLASLGTLSAGIAHEIKNPLNIIKNGAFLIQKFVQRNLRKYPNIEDQKELSETIEKDIEKLEDIALLIDKNVQRADSIVKNILNQSRTGESVLTQDQINKILTESLDYVFASHQQKFSFYIQTKFDLSGMDLHYFYAQDLSRAFINIFDNAFYAMNTKLGKKKFQPALEIRSFYEDNYIVVKIKDNGIGILDKDKKQILNPFYTTKPSGEGTGIGLAMVSDVVKMHDGSLEINSVPGEYSEFILRISKDLALKI